MRADGTFEMEARTRGKAQMEEDLMYGCEPRWFSPPEYDDSDAALLTVEGHWLQSDGAGAFVRFKVTHVEESATGRERPPITEDDIRYVCGRSLLNAIQGSWQGKQQVACGDLGWELNKNLEWNVLWHRDTDCGWAPPSDDDEGVDAEAY